MGLIPEETIQEVLAQTDIVALVEGYFPLRRRGQDFWAVCPFHNESTPSFKVSATRQNYHCFGCGAGGHAIRFVMEYESLDFPDAVKRLASQCGVVIREEASSPQDRARAAMRTQLLTLHKEATDWFHAQLLKGKGADADRARAYFKGRGVSGEVARRWKIGFAPADGKVFRDWAKAQGYNGRVMVESGLMAMPERGGRLYTRFRDRVMFPINNDFGDPIGFAGRILDPEAKTAKYVNSPETPLFSKSKILFGIDRSKRAISKAEAVILCEGQLDMIRCFETGVENVVATQGTACTEHHARTLRRFAGENGEALLCFDSDSAGYKAAIRAYTEISTAGLFVRAIELPDGEDPDSLIQSQGAEAFRERAAAARPFYHYQIDRLARTLDLSDLRDRVRFTNEVAPTIAVIADPIAREGVVNDVATRLGVPADDFRKRVAGVATEAERRRAPRGRENNSDPAPTAPAEVGDPDAEILLRLALTDTGTQKWMAEIAAEALPELPGMPGTALLTKVWKQPPRSAEPGETNVYTERFDPTDAATLNALVAGRFAATGLLDAKRAWLRMRIKRLESERAITVTQLRTPNLDKSQIFALTSKSESQRKELLELKLGLKNIA